MSLTTLQSEINDIISQIWSLLLKYPLYAVGFFLLYFLGLTVIFARAGVVKKEKVGAYILILFAVIAFVLTPLTLVGLAQQGIITA
jgi:hypothetical protein